MSLAGQLCLHCDSRRAYIRSRARGGASRGDIASVAENSTTHKVFSVKDSSSADVERLEPSVENTRAGLTTAAAVKNTTSGTVTSSCKQVKRKQTTDATRSSNSAADRGRSARLRQSSRLKKSSSKNSHKHPQNSFEKRRRTAKPFAGLQLVLVDRPWQHLLNAVTKDADSRVNSMAKPSAAELRDVAKAKRKIVAAVEAGGGRIVKLTESSLAELEGAEAGDMKLVCVALSSTPGELPLFSQCGTGLSGTDKPTNSQLDFLLARAIGADIVPVDWCWQSISAGQPLCVDSWRLLAQSSNACTSVGTLLPVEFRALRHGRRKAPMLISIRSKLIVQKSPRLRMPAEADWREKLVVASGGRLVVSGQVHCYLVDGTDRPRATSKVPCVTGSWLVACVSEGVRFAFDLHPAFEHAWPSR